MGHARVIRFLLAISIALFFGLLAYSGREALVNAWRDADHQLLVAATGLLSLANMGAAILFASLLRRGDSMSHGHAKLAGAFLFSQFAKYVPGRVWGVMAQSAVMRSASALPRLLEVNLELAGIVVAVTTGVGIALLLAVQVGYSAAFMVMATVYFIVAKGISSGWFPIAVRKLGRAVPFIRRMMDARGVGERSLRHNEDGRYMHASLAIYLGAYVSGWWLLVASLPRPEWASIAEIVAALSLSYVAGVVSFLPAGIGAREGAFLLLAPALSLPLEMVAAIAVASRAVLIVVDGISALVGYALIATGGRRGNA